MGSLCNWTEEHRCWTWTVCQAVRPAKKSRTRNGKAPEATLTELSDVADSYNRVRRPPLVITFNPSEEGMGYYVAKNTMGMRGALIAAQPMDLACARLVPESRGVAPSRVSRAVDAEGDVGSLF